MKKNTHNKNTDNIIKRVLNELYLKDTKSKQGIPTTQSDYYNAMKKVDNIIFENKILWICSVSLSFICMYLITRL